MRLTTFSIRGVALLCLAPILAACGPHPAAEIGPRAVFAPPEQGLVTDHVIIISMDGLRPDARSARATTPSS